jgi:thioredoxin 1
MASDLISNANDTNFGAEVLSSDKPVLVDFWAVWCQPCKAVAPKVENIAKSYPDTLKVVKVDVDSSPKTAMAYNVRSIPTLLVFKKGQVVGQVIGNQDEAKIRAALAAYV